MEPLEIRISLLRAGITQTEIAKRCKVTPTQIRRVIYGSVSDHVRQEIAKAVGKDVSEIWPEYYLTKRPKKVATV